MSYDIFSDFTDKTQIIKSKNILINKINLSIILLMIKSMILKLKLFC